MQLGWVVPMHAQWTNLTAFPLLVIAFRTLSTLHICLYQPQKVMSVHGIDGMPYFTVANIYAQEACHGWRTFSCMHLHSCRHGLFRSRCGNINGLRIATSYSACMHLGPECAGSFPSFLSVALLLYGQWLLFTQPHIYNRRPLWL
jgi:hypothetical protein